MMALWWRLVAFGFRLLYNELAFTYDWVSWFVSLGEWRSWQRAAMPVLPPPQAGDVLELAHGTGDLQIDLLRAGYAPIGYDLSSAMGAIAGRKLRREGLPVRLVRGDARALPFATDSLAAVVSTFPTDFILAPETLRAVYRVLKPGGVFVIVPSGVLTGGGVMRRFLEFLYTITGQRNSGGSLDVQAIFGEYGFVDGEVAEVPCRYSKAFVIILKKPHK